MKYSVIKFKTLKTHLITDASLLKCSIFVLFNIINRLQEILQVTLNGLNGQDVAYDRSKLVSQVGHVI